MTPTTLRVRKLSLMMGPEAWANWIWGVRRQIEDQTNQLRRFEYECRCRRRGQEGTA